MGKTKLNYQFHNSNTAEITTNYILKIFIEANARKVEDAIRQAEEEDLLNPVQRECSSA